MSARLEFPEARAGMPLTPELWNAARAAVRAGRIIGDGSTTRTHETPDGTHIHAVRSNAVWDHPFKATLTGNSATFSQGLFNGITEPEIDDVKLSEGAILRWKAPQLQPDGTGYLAAEVTFDEKWNLASATVVQVAWFDSDDGKTAPANGGISGIGGVPLLSDRRARWPLAMLVRRTGSELALFQITQGDLQVRAKPTDLTAATGRAFFW